ncbi:radical SAM protein [Alkalihalobacillus sp. 1P02AB]|uniref:SPL family radical SAM protein n=1 Tax=Alkalihalobacillus sp. 1P02AB TaxID=3132260 RepID=UPI0039A42034
MAKHYEETIRQPKKILTPASGFLKNYTHTLNPYVGCSFACSYCYVRKSPVGVFRGQEWGTWVDIKEVSKEKIKREIVNLRKRGKGVTIFMSSSTDPYQPTEYTQEVTRRLLEGMVEEPPDFLFIQTRSPLITRDIDLYKQLKGRFRISMTIETDQEAVRKRFTPSAPPIQARMKALEELKANQLPIQVAVSPILPFSEQFPEKLASLVEQIVLDDYVSGDGSGGRRTELLKVKELYQEDELNIWYQKELHKEVLKKMKNAFSEECIYLSQDGFKPFV